MVVTRMEYPKPGWTPYVVYTTEILSFLHNRILFQTVKRYLNVQSDSIRAKVFS